MSNSHRLGLGTRAVHAGQEADPATGSRAVPIYQTTSYLFRDTEHAANLFGLKELGNIYTRIMNPTTDVFEKRIADLEGGVAALAHSSGQAAITYSILNICQAGDHIVSASQLYGGTHTLFHYTLPKLGIEVSFVNAEDPASFAGAIRENTKALYAETLANPRLNVLNIPEVAKIAEDHGIPLIIDNTAASPYLCRPLEHGAHVVVHSATKYIGGHGTSIGGVVVDGGNFNWGNGKFPGFTEPDPSYHGLVHWDAFQAFPPAGGANVAYILKMRLQLLRDIGACLSPTNAFHLLQGLETLHLRMERHCDNAYKVAEFLEGHPGVAWVNYPGLDNHPSHALAGELMGGRFGALIGFGIKGGADAGRKFIESLQLFSHLANIGDAKSLAIHPATTTHSQLSPEELTASGVSEDYVRLSIGIEDYCDIEQDIKQALEKSM